MSIKIQCPNCESYNTSIVKDGFSNNPNEGKSYVFPLLKKYNLQNKDFRNSQKRIKCNNCFIKFLYPWLNQEQRNYIFIQKKYKHNAGWDSVERSITSPNKLMIQSISYRFLIKALNYLNANKINSYAEFNCPFSGPSLYNFSISNEFITKRGLFNLSIKRSAELSILSTVSDKFKNLSLFFLNKIFYYRYLKENTKIEKNNYEFLNNPTLIIENSSCFWSNNCVCHSKSCSSLGLDLFYKKIEYLNNLNNKYDLVFMSNIFDHLDKPTETLKKLLKKTKAIIIQTHMSNSVGYQHLYSINEEYFNALSKILNIKIISLGTFQKDNYNEFSYLIIKK